MVFSIRTTLDLDDDVLHAAKEIAAARGSTAGKVLSELTRNGALKTDSCATRATLSVIPAAQ